MCAPTEKEAAFIGFFLCKTFVWRWPILMIFFGATALSRKRGLVYMDRLLHKRVAQFKHRATTQIGVATSPRMSRGGKIATQQRYRQWRMAHPQEGKNIKKAYPNYCSRVGLMG